MRSLPLRSPQSRQGLLRPTLNSKITDSHLPFRSTIGPAGRTRLSMQIQMPLLDHGAGPSGGGASDGEHPAAPSPLKNIISSGSTN